jgi:hypothetical protein
VIAVVAGALANKPSNGGEAWVRLSYVHGLRRLGWTVHFVEEVDGDAAEPAGVAHFDAVAAADGAAASWTLLTRAGATLRGDRDRFDQVASEADLLVNVSGNLREPALLRRFRRSALVDVDPGYTQIWHDGGVEPILPHDVYFTIAENLGRPGCAVPTAGIRWRATRPPVVLADWPRTPAHAGACFTTVATWRGGYGALEHDGRRYGGKLHEFRKVLPLPRLAPQSFELALDISEDEQRDLAALRGHGWRLVDPRAVAATPARFRGYVQSSAGEFSAAQGVYVETRSGWFSDRTTRYLASGKPALVQDTGFGRVLPVGEGLLAFRTLDDAVAGARALDADYERHARAARQLAEECFDSDAVLTRLLADALP